MDAKECEAKENFIVKDNGVRERGQRAMTYRVKIACGNCCSENRYDIERETAIDDAELVCPNCGCCPTDRDFVILTPQKLKGKSKLLIEKGGIDAN